MLRISFLDVVLIQIIPNVNAILITASSSAPEDEALFEKGISRQGTTPQRMNVAAKHEYQYTDDRARFTPRLYNPAIHCAG